MLEVLNLLDRKKLSAKVARLYTVNCIFPYAIVAVALMASRVLQLLISPPVRADSIPAQISLLPGAIDQILSQKSSESTSDIWGLVKGHKQNVCPGLKTLASLKQLLPGSRAQLELVQGSRQRASNTYKT
ncbi:hypothetical protein B0H11DRAFT_1909683 [Mycena galericulata]|nr:hypothetical protein B0H11DRAFT_1909683 [Mycena galericulata]